MSEMNETDRKLAQELLAAWDGSSAHRPAIEQAVNSMSEDAVSMAQTARRLVTAELAATPMADEDALVEAMGQAIQDEMRPSDGWIESEAARFAKDMSRAALDAMRPTLAALQAHAEFLERDGQILQKERNEWREAWGKLMQEHSNKCAALQARAEAAEAKNARLWEALANPPRHVFWGAGEPDCPREIKASNGELHTLRCKICGLENPRDDICRAALGDKS